MEKVQKTTTTDFKLSENRPAYPVEPRQVPYGMGLFATRDLPVRH